MSQSLADAEAQALRQQAIIDVASAVNTCVEMVEAGHDMTTWLADLSAHWTGDHARAAVLLMGMIVTAAGVDPEVVAAMGGALLQ